jgi:hypothetical protein
MSKKDAGFAGEIWAFTGNQSLPISMPPEFYGAPIRSPVLNAIRADWERIIANP